MERKTHIYSIFSLGAEHRLINEYTRHTEDVPAPENKSEKEKEHEDYSNPESDVENQYNEKVQKAQEAVDNPVILEELVDEITNPEGNVEKRYNEEILGANDVVEDPETKEKLKQNAMVESIFNEIVEEINSQSPKSRLIADKLNQLNDLAFHITRERNINYDGLKNYIENNVNNKINGRNFRLYINENNKIELEALFSDSAQCPAESQSISTVLLEEKVKAWGQIDMANELVDLQNTSTLEGRENDLTVIYDEMKEMENSVKAQNVDIHENSAFRKAMNALEALVNPKVEPKKTVKTEPVPLPRIVGEKTKRERAKKKRPQPNKNKEVKRIRKSAKKFEKENPEASKILKDVASNPKEYLNISKNKAKEVRDKIGAMVNNLRSPKVTSETIPTPEPENAKKTPLPPKPAQVSGPPNSLLPDSTSEPVPTPEKKEEDQFNILSKLLDDEIGLDVNKIKLPEGWVVINSRDLFHDTENNKLEKNISVGSDNWAFVTIKAVAYNGNVNWKVNNLMEVEEIDAKYFNNKNEVEKYLEERKEPIKKILEEQKQSSSSESEKEPAPETSSESDTEIEPEIKTKLDKILSEFNEKNATIVSVSENANPEDYEKIIKSLPNIEAAISELDNDDRFALEEVPILLTNSNQNTGLTPTDIYGENVININYLQTSEEITETILNSVAQIEETEKDNEGKS